MADQEIKRELLPANMWGEGWKAKLSEMHALYCCDDKSNDTPNLLNEKQYKTGIDVNLQQKPKKTLQQKPKKTLQKKNVNAPLLCTNEKYLQRLQGFSTNQLASRLRAPRVWEEAVGMWTNGYDKMQFCVVMVSLLLDAFALMC